MRQGISRDYFKHLKQHFKGGSLASVIKELELRDKFMFEHLNTEHIYLSEESFQFNRLSEAEIDWNELINDAKGG